VIDSATPEQLTLTLALAIADDALASRVRDLLGAVAGITLVDAEADADIILSDGRAATVPDLNLTARERDVLALLAEGASNKAVANRLGISVHTAKFHVRSLLEKLDATGRTDAVAHAARLGVIDL
jgi:DNA-binding CsgD family transcriptional regulator